MMNKYSPYTHKVRYSNMELFRVIAMFLVLVVHSGFFSLGAPTEEDFGSDLISSFLRVLIQGFSIGCVNMFVLLSGWFGIHPSRRGLLKFLFQCAFFLWGIYGVCLLFHLSSISMDGIKGCFLLLNWNWFIKAYLLLYLLAPILNAYIDGANERQFRFFLIFFFSFQTIFSWLTNATMFFQHGYSTISFVGLYMLARYMAKYGSKYTSRGKYIYLLVYIISSLLLAVLYYFMQHHGKIVSKIFQYDNPLVILSSLSLLIYFSKLNFRSRFINWLGASSFAVFLLHTNPNLCLQYFVPMIQHLYSSYEGIYSITFISVFLLCVFIFAILIDQIRIRLWKVLQTIIMR